MKKLVRSLENLKKSDVKRVINSQIREMKKLGRRSDDDIFKELCFCILTANFNAVGGIKIQDAIGDGFLTLSEKRLAKRLTELGHRYPNVRAKYIIEARKHKNDLKNKPREWIVDNVKGLGYKEASHFLRNIGKNEYAIIDFHIVDLLVDYGLIERPKTMTKRRYLEIENILKRVSEKAEMTLGELDFYLWYMETGKVLK